MGQGGVLAAGSPTGKGNMVPIGSTKPEPQSHTVVGPTHAGARAQWVEGAPSTLDLEVRVETFC